MVAYGFEGAGEFAGQDDNFNTLPDGFMEEWNKETEYYKKMAENRPEGFFTIEKIPLSLADRMKMYESKNSTRLDAKIPVIIRVDGKGFSKYTKQFQKPFDDLLIQAMHYCAEKVSEELQGFRLAYAQSDEISFLVTNSGKENSEICFGGKVNKINSICASVITAHFNQFMSRYSTVKQLAYFDCRCFHVPEDDVSNYFLHRARDWSRNSVTMLGREHFSHKEMHGKNKDEVKANLLQIKQVDWNKLTDDLKYGTFITKGEEISYVKDNVEAEYSKVDEFIQGVVGFKK